MKKSTIEYEYRALVPDENIEGYRALLIDKAAEHSDNILQCRVIMKSDQLSGNGWLRIRKAGNYCTVAHKIIAENDDTTEYEIQVESFDDAVQLFKSLGFIQLSYQENYREVYIVNGCEIVIDRWPQIGYVIESEASSYELAMQGLKELGIEDGSITKKGIYDIYKDHGIDLDTVSRLTF